MSIAGHRQSLRTHCESKHIIFTLVKISFQNSITRVGLLSGFPIPRKNLHPRDKESPNYPEAKNSSIPGMKIRKLRKNPESRGLKYGKQKFRIPGIKIPIGKDPEFQGFSENPDKIPIVRKP